MHIRNLNIIFMLISGIIVTIISIVFRYSIDRLVYTLLVVLIIFFIIGSIIQWLLNSIGDKAERMSREQERQRLEDEVKALQKKEKANEMNKTKDKES